MQTEKTPPSAEAMILSLRAMGYDLSTAIADLIDNSITAGANNIHVDYDWNDGNPWILITDDGKGMNESELKKAMKPGSQSPEDERDAGDLGRFGLGLKTASWSQSRKMTVLSKKNQKFNDRCWNIDHIIKTDEWELIIGVDESTEKKLMTRLSNFDSGTSVLWENLDRLIGDMSEQDGDSMKKIFQEKMTKDVLHHLQMVFHRYLSGRDSKRIFLGNFSCEPWDPFMTYHESTEEIVTEKFSDSRISITPYILPHPSKMSEQEREDAQGPRGWSLQQGFYVYRHKRMIICGGYLDLDLKTFDHHRLCRIKVDITNDLDHEWRVDVKKETASPPMRYRNDLLRIAKNTRERSGKRYKARATMVGVKGPRRAKDDVWSRKRIGEKYLYKVNRESPAIKFLQEQLGISKSNLNALLHVIERTVPHRSITVDNNEFNDSTVDLPEENIRPPQALIDTAKLLVRQEISNGKTPEMAVDFVARVVFPIENGEFREALDSEFLE